MKERVLQQIIQYRKFFAVVAHHYFGCQLNEEKVNKLPDMVFYKAFLSELAATIKKEEQLEFYQALKALKDGYIAELDIFLEKHAETLAYLHEQLCSEKRYVKDKISAWEVSSAECPFSKGVKDFSNSSHLIIAAKNNDLMALQLLEQELSQYETEIKNAEFRLTKIADRRQVPVTDIVETLKQDLAKKENDTPSAQKFLKLQIGQCENALHKIKLNTHRQEGCLTLVCWADQEGNTALHHAALRNHIEFIYGCLDVCPEAAKLQNNKGLTFADILFDNQFLLQTLRSYKADDLKELPILFDYYKSLLTGHKRREEFYRLCMMHMERICSLIPVVQQEFTSICEVLNGYSIRRSQCKPDDIAALNVEFLAKLEIFLNVENDNKKLFVYWEQIGEVIPEFKEWVQLKKRACALRHQEVIKIMRTDPRSYQYAAAAAPAVSEPVRASEESSGLRV